MARKGGPAEVTIKEFLGINNVDDPEVAKPGQLQIAQNVDIDDMGRVRRRDGYSRVFTATAPHSLWSDGETCLFREGVYLKKLNTDWTATTLRSGLTTQTRMNFLKITDRIFYTDETVVGTVQNGTDRTWGLTPPPVPSLSAVPGQLVEGRYLCVLTYVRNDGQESGSSLPVSIDVTAGGGIIVSSITPSTDPTVMYVYVYLTTCNGETLYLAGVIANGTTSFTYTGTTGEFRLPLATANLYPPPAGQLFAYYRGRIYVASGSAIWYSTPYGYELFDLAHGYIPLDSRITLLAPVNDGLWVATQNVTAFLSGPDGPELKYEEKLDEGAVEGTQVKLDTVGRRGEEITAWAWTNDCGVVIGFDSGIYKSATRAFYSPAEASKGAALLREETDRTLYVVSLFT